MFSLEKIVPNSTFRNRCKISLERKRGAGSGEPLHYYRRKWHFWPEKQPTAKTLSLWLWAQPGALETACTTEWDAWCWGEGNVDDQNEDGTKWLLFFVHVSCAKHCAKHSRNNNSSYFQNNLMKWPHFTDDQIKIQRVSASQWVKESRFELKQLTQVLSS